MTDDPRSTPDPSAPEGAPQDGPAPDGPAPDGATTGGTPDVGWRERLAAGDVEAALQRYDVALREGLEHDRAVREALATLARWRAALHEKAWPTAQRDVERTLGDADDGDVPRAAEVGGVRLAAAGDVVRGLADAGAALDARDLDAADAALAALEDTAAPFDAERLAQVGSVALLRGEEDAARAALEGALARDPRHLRAMTNLGNLDLEAGDVDGAIARYEAALAIDDGYARALHNLGVAYRRRGEVGRSVQALRRAQRLERKRDTDAARRDVRARREAAGTRWRVWLGVAAAAVLAWWLLR